MMRPSNPPWADRERGGSDGAGVDGGGEEAGGPLQAGRGHADFRRPARLQLRHGGHAAGTAGGAAARTRAVRWDPGYCVAHCAP